MTEPNDVITEVASQFAAALDRDDYQAAEAFLTDETTYTIHGKLYIGPREILDRYRRSSEWAASTFDRVDYDSSVEHLDENRAEVTFVDQITHGDDSLHHEARQILTIDPQDRVIDGIKHRDLPDDEETVDEFLERAGIDRPPVSGP